MQLNPDKTALVLIGFQNDFFAPDGILRESVEEPAGVTGTLKNTLALVRELAPTGVAIVTTPIMFTPDYSELVDPVGILKAIKDLGAFRSGSPGSRTIPELLSWGDRVREVPGKRGLNAFSNTGLDEMLRERGVRDVAICGVVASLCIDSSARAALDLGYRVWILSDCVSGRTIVEQEFYRSEVFPLYAQVVSSMEFLGYLGVPRAGAS